MFPQLRFFFIAECLQYFLLLFEEAALTTRTDCLGNTSLSSDDLSHVGRAYFQFNDNCIFFSFSVTTTSSGCSTRDFAITSTNSFITYLPVLSMTGL